MGKFKLINPVITGSFNDQYESSTAGGAAKEFWEALTSDGKYVTGNVPQFMFTLQDVSSDKLYHFLVKEQIAGSKADYSIDEINVKMSDDEKKQLFNEINKVKKDTSNLIKGEQSGGKRRRYNDDDDSSSSSSSSSGDSDKELHDLYKYIRLKNSVKPIVYWWYAPSIYKTNTWFTPTFVAPLSPYVQTWIPTQTWIPMR